MIYLVVFILNAAISIYSEFNTVYQTQCSAKKDILSTVNLVELPGRIDIAATIELITQSDRNEINYGYR